MQCRNSHSWYKLTINSNRLTALLVALLFQCLAFGQQGSISGSIKSADEGVTLGAVSVYLTPSERLIYSNNKGVFRFDRLKEGTYNLVFFKEGFTTLYEQVELKAKASVKLQIALEKLSYDLHAVEIQGGSKDDFGLRKLRNVEGTGIYAAKKSEVIEVNYLVANLAINNARQIYKGIAGLNIWESDGAGLQLSIGARGLDPNRTSNFNTRQNGYDISADALGYPESYYTPPSQALERIEIVRGAASLQYGSQFGGLLNFIFKKGKTGRQLELFSENTVGSFGLLSSFNSVSGSKGDWRYYGFYQRKQGNGWRPNSEFAQNNAYAHVEKKISDQFKIGVEYTFMNYLAQQPGGLQDFEFQQDARQSKRSRNWFQVNWNLAALTLDYRINEKTRLNSRSFLLAAGRDALGELGPINRPDPLRERDLIKGRYTNFGNETRLITRYEVGHRLSTFLVGFRYYQGYTTNEQGDASAGIDSDFTFLHPDNLERAAYEFPSRNISLFAENLFTITDRLSITPGLRFEYIRTASDGYYKERVFSGGQVIFEQKFEQAKENNRALVLAGLGIGYQLQPTVELYGNFSQNYRSINFTDLAVINPNLVVDSLLTDEQGYNIDMGLRGSLADGSVKFDASAFYLRYKNRIGIDEIVVADPLVVERAVAFRTNIGDARILGLELYGEADIWKLLVKNNYPVQLSLFTNLSWLHGKYLSGPTAVVGNDVELIPTVNLKTGLNLQWKQLKASYQFSYVGEQFSDATNANFVVNATRGIVPAYQVQDISLSYELKKFRFQTGINNLLDERYFTRRAVAYPGPGIIPADGRSFYGSIAVRL